MLRLHFRKLTFGVGFGPTSLVDRQILVDAHVERVDLPRLDSRLKSSQTGSLNSRFLIEVETNFLCPLKQVSKIEEVSVHRVFRMQLHPVRGKLHIWRLGVIGFDVVTRLDVGVGVEYGALDADGA